MIRSSNRNGAHQAQFTNGTLTSDADVPREKGGEGRGFGPHELLEAALATCMTISVQLYAEKQGIPLVSVQCEVRLDRSVPEALVLRCRLQLEGNLSPEQREKLRTAASTCPVGRTLRNSPAVELLA